MPRRAPTAATSPPDPAHARFSPSASSRWLNCPGSILLHEQMRAEPDYVEPPPGEAAVAGSLMHTYADWLLSGQPLRSALPVLTAEQAALVDVYVSEVQNARAFVRDLTGEEPLFFTEQRYNTGIRDCWGTVDSVIISPSTRECWIIDLKTGHQRVDAIENTQLMIYAVGVLHAQISQLGTYAGEWTFHLKIVQPRDEENPIKSWTCTEAHIVEFRRRVRQIVGLVALEDRGGAVPVARVVGDWCTYCPAASQCPEQQARAVSVFGSDTPSSPAYVESITADASDLTPRSVTELNETQLRFFLTNREHIRDFLAACENRALQAPPTGWKVVAANTRRRWTDADAVARALVRSGNGALMRAVPPTIGDAQRLLGSSHPIIQTYAVAPPGGPTLVPESDPRPALDRTAVFGLESSGATAAPARE